MSVSAAAAAGAALAFYYVNKRGGVCSAAGEYEMPAETHVGVHSAPTTFMEDLFFLAEGLRWVPVGSRVTNRRLLCFNLQFDSMVCADKPPVHGLQQPTCRHLARGCAGAGTTPPLFCHGVQVAGTPMARRWGAGARLTC
jgi:hypothetical protein